MLSRIFGPNKVALCFIISYDHVLHQEAMWKRWIAPNADIVNVYFHCKDRSGAAVESEFIRAHMVPPKFCAVTTYVNVTPAYLATMFYARSHDPHNRWFCMLTDSCVPAMTPTGFRRMFDMHHAKSIIRVRDPYWNIHMHARGNLKKLPASLRLTNDPWFVYTLAHVNLMETFLKTFASVYDTVNAGGFANESIFGIVLQAYGQRNKPSVHLNLVSTVADWSRMPKPTSPFTFKFVSTAQTRIEQGNMRLMLRDAPAAMFLRKVDASFPASALENVMVDGPTLPARPSSWARVCFVVGLCLCAFGLGALYELAGATSDPAT
jgi:hypothetical protein